MKDWQRWALGSLGLGAALMLAALVLVGFDFRRLDVTATAQAQARTASYRVARGGADDASDGKQVRAIEVCGGMPDVNVHVGSGTELTLEYTDTSLMHWEIEQTDGGTLRLTLRSELKWYDYLGMHFPNAHSLTIGLPSDATLDALHVGSTSGDINVSRLPRVSDVALSSTSGIIRCGYEPEAESGVGRGDGGAGVGTLSLSTTSGNWRLENLSVEGDVSISATSGCGWAKALSAGSLRMESTSGECGLSDVDVRGNVFGASTSGGWQLTDVRALGDVAVGSTSGDIIARGLTAAGVQMGSTSGTQVLTNVEATDAIQLSAASGNVHLGVASAGAIDVDTTSGDVAVELPGAASAYAIRTETTSGDAYVPAGANGDCPVSIRTTSGIIHVSCEDGAE